MKKSFTLSEALITLAIIGVLAAILIPVINNVRPDKDRVAYKKALYTMQSAISNAMDSTEYSMAANSAAYWREGGKYGKDFCHSIADALNITGKVNCDGPFPNCPSTSSSCYESPNFITTDGIRYWNLENAFPGSTDTLQTVYVDRNIGTNELRSIERARQRSGSDAYGMKIQVRYDGKIGTDMGETGEDFGYENEMVEQSLQVTAGKRN